MSARDEAAGGVAKVGPPPPMPQNARSELYAIAERLQWLANEPDADAGMASTVTWQRKLDDAKFLQSVAAALSSPSPRDQASSALLGACVSLMRAFDRGLVTIDMPHETERHYLVDIRDAIALARSAGIETEENG